MGPGDRARRGHWRNLNGVRRVDLHVACAGDRHPNLERDECIQATEPGIVLVPERAASPSALASQRLISG